MQNVFKTTTILGLTLLLFSCENPTNDTQLPNETAEPTATTEPEKEVVLKGDYCFLKAENKDTTTVKIRILSDDDIRGEMIWSPWQKDGAVGTLTGKLISKNEMELLYSYTIEGNRQSEIKIMKIENNILQIKKGELTDLKNDGNLTYKDVSKAVYKETLTKINCD